VAGGTPRGSKPAILPKYVQGVLRDDGGPGDWDRGLSKQMDGAFGNKVDEGNVRFEYGEGEPSYRIPYFKGRSIEETGQSFFSPNRQLPSAVMLGSLPTGVVRGKPWQTLLFRPDHDTPQHPGVSEFPVDHLMLDLFHVPIVEPYAISEPFSTAGKVNMNYVIAPFGYAKGNGGTNPGTTTPRSYLRRDSALRGVLKSTFVMAVPNATPDGGHNEKALSVSTQFRWPIDLNKTLEQFDRRMNNQTQTVSIREKTLFRSPSEICDIDLWPDGLPVSNWPAFWDANLATGDNMRERPYSHIYPRLTTKSNVFTIHMRCQALKKSPKTDPDDFDEDRDQVLGEYRGSATIERFIDPNDVQLRDYNPKERSVDPYYRFRVIGMKRFSAN
jgi:uncharacterized protein (TIGR02600 family)